MVGFLAAVAMIAVIWFASVAPSERRYHQRKLKLMQERIERRQRHLDQQSPRSADVGDLEG